MISVTAKVPLNGKDLGVVWCNPRRGDITDAIKSGDNELEIEVVNSWPNRQDRLGSTSQPQPLLRQN